MQIYEALPTHTYTQNYINICSMSWEKKSWYILEAYAYDNNLQK